VRLDHPQLPSCPLRRISTHLVLNGSLPQRYAIIAGSGSPSPPGTSPGPRRSARPVIASRTARACRSSTPGFVYSACMWSAARCRTTWMAGSSFIILVLVVVVDGLGVDAVELAALPSCPVPGDQGDRLSSRHSAMTRHDSSSVRCPIPTRLPTRLLRSPLGRQVRRLLVGVRVGTARWLPARRAAASSSRLRKKVGRDRSWLGSEG
jgi:hypothetical protein